MHLCVHVCVFLKSKIHIHVCFMLFLIFKYLNIFLLLVVEYIYMIPKFSQYMSRIHARKFSLYSSHPVQLCHSSTDKIFKFCGLYL